MSGLRAARQWAVEKTQSLVGHHKLDYLKHDCGPIMIQCNKTDHRHHYGVDASYWATMGYYEVQENLRRPFPRSCWKIVPAAATSRILASSSARHYTVTTDTLSNLPDRQSIYDSTFALPPLLLQAYTYDNYYPVQGDNPGTFLWRSAMMGAWQIDPTDTRLGRPENESVRRSVQIYKEWVRPMLDDQGASHLAPTRRHPLGRNVLLERCPPQRRPLHLPSGKQRRPKDRQAQGPGIRKNVLGLGRRRIRIARGPHWRRLMEKGLTVKLLQPYKSDMIYLQDAALGKPEGLDAPGAFHLTAAATSRNDPFALYGRVSWEPSRGAKSYRVVVSESPDLANPIASSTVVSPSTTATLEVPPQKSLYWKVEAAGWGGRQWTRARPACWQPPA